MKPLYVRAVLLLAVLATLAAFLADGDTVIWGS